ncbi:Rid family hydrolase [Bosea robiniae]|uniref:Enamine deaminase RidA, house cleaning of reactive enamine intermediates, YjgF/YER057c/UK114 family n=1 Tax=Bosea robiniae TaxID=1036780 RepID=A0ABY0PAJ7_9HYPH|nr:Rid family hydrolase [Bosea robiniae]SDH27505.1 Enamine deaminase RidA, house cleaning of reactive enamine intermediates, YjgF/YER057c/UK114 family [Bosea robiniae]
MAIKRSIRTPIQNRVVEAGNLAFVGGVVADDTKQGMGPQTQNILGKIEGYLGEVGLDRKAIVAAQIFVTDLTLKKEMDAVWTSFFGEDMPTRATVGVADLGGPLIEIVVTASR